MKKLLFSILVLLVAIFPMLTQAQPRPEGNRIEALKIAFLTRRLNLSPQEAQPFWPVYNKYTEEIRKTQQELRENKESEIEIEEKILGIRKRYHTDFSKILGNEKANDLFRAEKDFRGMVQQEIMERRNQRPPEFRNRPRQQ